MFQEQPSPRRAPRSQRELGQGAAANSSESRLASSRSFEATRPLELPDSTSSLLSLRYIVRMN